MANSTSALARQQMLWFFSVRIQLIVALATCAAATAGLWWTITNHQHTWVHWLVCWLLVVNVVAFAYYGLDKYLARRSIVVRIPEVVLHTLAGVGGSPAALLAMSIFRHKTIKPSFRIVFWCIVVVQIVLTAYVVKLLWWT